MEKICVAVRMRPPVSEQNASSSSSWQIDENRVTLHKPHGTPISSISYAYDHVFDENCSNSEVYELLTKDIIHAAVDGFNGTAFAYGQTSSGKTFTMNGSKTDPGIIYRAVKDVFARINSIADREFLIRVSYMEIYNEEIKDLLTVENQKLQIHESLERGVFVAGLREEIVNDVEQVLKLIEIGEVNRHFGETNMNVRSSRSHTIFRMVIESKGKDANSSSENADAIRFSVLNLVDLAGSERIAKTGADGVRLREGKHINKSLLMLGNVINKLSDGSRQRGHIPYRDSKLTRILQPALGGNAKTSIICTIAPEEVHVEETKGTLQFASRAKRITNCAQVNEILTDAALLKRQQLEIEELRKKLEGSHAEVLEQEILKLRNQMLKFELEKEKLTMELEEERRSQREWNQRLTSSDHDQTSQSQTSVGQCLKEECNGSSSMNGDIFGTPSMKVITGAFVAKRSSYSRLSDDSPLPDALNNVADEDTWLKINKGYVADLDLLQTPASNDTIFPSNNVTPVCSSGNWQQEVQNIRRQLEVVMEEKNELEKRHTEQRLLNDQLVAEVSELKQGALRVQEFPQKLGETMVNFKDIYDDVLSTIQSSISDGKLVNDKLLSSISEFGTCLISTLQSHLFLEKEVDNVFNKSSEQCKMLSERLEKIVRDLVYFETSTPRDQQQSMRCSCKDKESIVGEDTDDGNLATELNNVNGRSVGLEKELELSNKLLEDSKHEYKKLEREYQVLKDDRNSLLIRVAESSEKLALISDQKENITKDLNSEVQKRVLLEEEIKKLGAAFSSRQKLLMSLHNEFKSKVETLPAQNPAMAPRFLGL